MAIQNITYDNKTALNQNADIPNVNKVTDNDMNEIKSVVNNNATELANIIESNSYYTKLSDGTLICRGSAAITATDSRSQGNLDYYSGETTVTLPSTFVDTDYTIVTNVTVGNMNRFCQSYGVAVSTTQITLYYTNTTQNEARSVSYIAIGRWK